MSVRYVLLYIHNVRGRIDVVQEQYVLMEIFAQRLRERAAQLGISNAEAARRCELEERRYAHYVAGRREPDLSTLVKIAGVLGTTPNWLLGLDVAGSKATVRAGLTDRLANAAREMSDRELKLFVVQAEAIARSNDL